MNESLTRFGSNWWVLQKCCVYDPCETFSRFHPSVWLAKAHLGSSWGLWIGWFLPGLWWQTSHWTHVVLCSWSWMEGPHVPRLTLRSWGSLRGRVHWEAGCSGPFTMPRLIWTSHLAQVRLETGFLIGASCPYTSPSNWGHQMYFWRFSFCLTKPRCLDFFKIFIWLAKPQNSFHFLLDFFIRLNVLFTFLIVCHFVVINSYHWDVFENLDQNCNRKK